jgi:poly [ADP-ribose] polymerase
MFGAGIYFADMSGKAARYCASHLLQIFMLLCEVEIGKDPLNVQNCERNAAAILKDQRRVGVVAHGRSNHNGWINAKYVHRRLDGVRMPDVSKGRAIRPAQSLAYNEYVVYDPAQIQQRYLFHLRTG